MPDFSITIDPRIWTMNALIGVQVFADPAPPFTDSDIHMFVCGDLYNLATIRAMHPRALTLLTDHEVLVFLYRHYGLEYLLQWVDGCFSMLVLDQRLTLDHTHLYVVTDPYGIHPVFYTSQIGKHTSRFGFSTRREPGGDNRPYLHPGTRSEWTLSTRVQARWCEGAAEIPYSCGVLQNFPPDSPVRERFRAKYAERLQSLPVGTRVLYIGDDDPYDIQKNMRDLIPEYLTWREAEFLVPGPDPETPMLIFATCGLITYPECSTPLDADYRVRRALKDIHCRINGEERYRKLRTVGNVLFPFLDRQVLDQYFGRPVDERARDGLFV